MLRVHISLQSTAQSSLDAYCANITLVSLQRKSVAAIATSVDRAIGHVVESLKTAGMYQNSLIVLSTDNGGPTDGADNNNMNNFPLRGCACSGT